MSTQRDSYNFIGSNFVIENNILKGACKKIDLPEQSVGEVILKHLENNPNHVAQIDAVTDKRTTYAEMRENSSRCAVWLKKQRVCKDDVIAICTHNQLDAYIPCIATFLVGAIYNPWFHEINLSTARHLMTLTKPKIVFVCETAAETLMEAARSENLNPVFIIIGAHENLTSLKDIMKLQTTEEVEKFRPEAAKNQDDMSIILFSSGTTGFPKSVAHSYNTVLQIVLGSTDMPTKNLVVLWYSSLYWISGTSYMLQSLLNNATRIIPSSSDPEETCRIIEKYKVNRFYSTPYMATCFSKVNIVQKYKLDSLRAMITGGTKISIKVLQDLKSNLPHVDLIQVYGMTEIGGLAAMQTKNCKKLDSVGFVLENVQIKVVDVDDRKSLGPNKPGEFYVKTSTMMIGYYNDPVSTKSATDDEGWIHTGDRVYYTESGEIVVIDRIKDVMKFRGHPVSPNELEEVILKHPAVMEAVVVPVPHDLDLERPMAFVKKVPRHQVTEKELVDMTSVLGDLKKLWGGVVFLDEMPYLASGKINRKDLKERAKALRD